MGSPDFYFFWKNKSFRASLRSSKIIKNDCSEGPGGGPWGKRVGSRRPGLGSLAGRSRRDPGKGPEWTPGARRRNRCSGMVPGGSQGVPGISCQILGSVKTNVCN